MVSADKYVNLLKKTTGRNMYFTMNTVYRNINFTLNAADKNMNFILNTSGRKHIPQRILHVEIYNFSVNTVGMNTNFIMNTAKSNMHFTTISVDKNMNSIRKTAEYKEYEFHIEYCRYDNEFHIECYR